MRMAVQMTNCRKCGAVLPLGSIEGYCRRCLASVAFGDAFAAADEVPTAGLRGLGRYELLEEIGHGGMGIVYRARQAGLNREVALKVLRLGPFAAEAEIARFRREAAAAARLRHPNIVAVFEEGEADGHAYFSMELVEGRTLAQLTQDGPIDPARAARYLASIATAVAAAHAAGVLHRDLKPANVIIDLADQPRVTDFGLAKRLDVEDVTLTQGVIGSPSYMAPEQADPRRGLIGISSDVYALGALLYHLLTGRPPFAGAGVTATLEQVLRNEPVGPRQLNPAIPADLETICLKCLAKGPAERYATAQALADDLHRFQSHQPILARPTGPVERLWRWSRRQPLIAALAGGILLLLVALVLGSSIAALRIARASRAEHAERRNAVEATVRLTEAMRLLELERAEDLFASGQSATAMAHLADMLRRDPSNHIAAARLTSALLHRNIAVLALPPLLHGGPVTWLEVHPNGIKFVVGSRDGTARLWSARSGRALGDLMPHNAPVTVARFKRDKDFVVTAAEDGKIRCWHGESGRPMSEFFGHDRAVNSLDFHPAEQWLLSGSDDTTARIWSVPEGTLLRTVSTGSSGITIARFSPTGDRFAAGSVGGGLRVWDTATGKEIWRAPAHRAHVTALEFSRDGRRLLTASRDQTARLWDTESGRESFEALRHPDWVLSAGFSPKESVIMTAGQDGLVRFWNTKDGLPWRAPLKHDGAVRGAVYGFGGSRVATASLDVTARLWDPVSGEPKSQPLWHGEMVTQIAFARGDSRLITGSADSLVRVWRTESIPHRPKTLLVTNHIHSMTLSPDGRQLATATRDGRVDLWDVATGDPIGPTLQLDSDATGVRFSGDGRLLAVAGGRRHELQMWDLASRTPRWAAPPRHEKVVHAIRFSPDNALLLTASADGTARLWRASDGESAGPPMQHDGAVLLAEFSPDGRSVATASRDRTARIWEVATGRPLTPWLRHLDEVNLVTFSPDGRRVVTASADNHARIWDVRSGDLVEPLLRHSRGLSTAKYSPDGRRIVTASMDRTARLWDAATGQALCLPMRHGHFVSDASFSPDGRRVVTSSNDGTIRLWDAETGRALTEALSWAQENLAYRPMFTADGRRVVALKANAGAAIWELPEVARPVPGWFIRFAEGIAGLRISPQGNPELAPRTALSEYESDAGLIPGDDDYARIARWLMAGPRERRESPWSAAPVVTHLRDGGPGSLREAIKTAQPLDVIRFSPGVQGTLALTLGELVIDKALSIAGPGASALSLSGQGRSRVLRVAHYARLQLSGLTITDGLVIGTNGLDATASRAATPGGDALGGGILNEGMVRLTDCFIVSNRVQGGIGGRGFSQAGAPSQPGAKGGDGSGAAVHGSGRWELLRCTIRGNTSLGGRGGHSFAEDQEDQEDDGGPAASPGTGGGSLGACRFTDALLDRCTIKDNAAFGGSGGASSHGRGGAGGPVAGGGVTGPATLANCIVVSNRVTGGPGGAGREPGPAGTTFGAGLNSFGSVASESFITDNAGSPDSPDVYGQVMSRGGNRLGSTNGSTGWIAGDQLTGKAVRENRSRFIP